MTPDQMMQRMGFSPDDNGPHVMSLRQAITRQMAGGMTDHSPGSWAPGDHSAEDRARAFLQVEWAVRNGHAFESKCLDRPIHWAFNTKTMRRSLVIRWRDLPAWIGDRRRETAMRLRILRDKMVGRTNPWR